jgi:hypothetical protein
VKPNINCACYLFPGRCTHQAAPRRWFGIAKCILTEIETDPRKEVSCVLRVPVEKGRVPPKPPPRRLDGKPEGPPNQTIKQTFFD